MPLCLLMALSMGAAQGAPLTGAHLLAALRAGGCVILMRHARSPAAPPPAAEADADNRDHERQLDAGGRASAQAMGAALRSLALPMGEVLSSPTYRARETLRLLGWPQPRIQPELGDGGHSMQADKSGRRGAWLRSRVASAPQQHTDMLIVTQMPNIAEAFPDDAQGLTDGEALVFRVEAHGQPRLIARVRMDQWESLAAAR